MILLFLFSRDFQRVYSYFKARSKRILNAHDLEIMYQQAGFLSELFTPWIHDSALVVVVDLDTVAPNPKDREQ